MRRKIVVRRKLRAHAWKHRSTDADEFVDPQTVTHQFDRKKEKEIPEKENNNSLYFLFMLFFFYLFFLYVRYNFDFRKMLSPFYNCCNFEQFKVKIVKKIVSI